MFNSREEYIQSKWSIVLEIWRTLQKNNFGKLDPVELQTFSKKQNLQKFKHRKGSMLWCPLFERFSTKNTFTMNYRIWLECLGKFLYMKASLIRELRTVLIIVSLLSVKGWNPVWSNIDLPEKVYQYANMLA